MLKGCDLLILDLPWRGKENGSNYEHLKRWKMIFDTETDYFASGNVHISFQGPPSQRASSVYRITEIRS
jgi:hypothetical protein